MSNIKYVLLHTSLDLLVGVSQPFCGTSFFVERTRLPSMPLAMLTIKKKSCMVINLEKFFQVVMVKRFHSLTGLHLVRHLEPGRKLPYEKVRDARRQM